MFSSDLNLDAATPDHSCLIWFLQPQLSSVTAASGEEMSLCVGDDYCDDDPVVESRDGTHNRWDSQAGRPGETSGVTGDQLSGWRPKMRTWKHILHHCFTQHNLLKQTKISNIGDK